MSRQVGDLRDKVQTTNVPRHVGEQPSASRAATGDLDRGDRKESGPEPES